MVKSINGHQVVKIDGINTVVKSIKGNVLHGWILNSDFTMTECVVLKRNNMFAHGETYKLAKESLEEKLFEGLSEDERIEVFINEFKQETKYPAMKFFDWHNKLTGSCEFGRKAFAKNNNINLETDTYTINEFISITRNDYGKETIKRLEERIKEN